MFTLFIYILQTFCGMVLYSFYGHFVVIFVFWLCHPGLLPLLFYRGNMNILQRFHVVLLVYFTNITCTFD